MTLANSSEVACAVIGRQIRYWRLGRHLSQAGLARAARVDQSSISNYESGKRHVAACTMIRIAEALRIELEDLLTEEARQAVLGTQR